jgi:hypothetical protein
MADSKARHETGTDAFAAPLSSSLIIDNLHIKERRFLLQGEHVLDKRRTLLAFDPI